MQWRQDPEALVKDLATHWVDGRIKLFVAFRGLAARKDFADVFAKGDYQPLRATGAYAERVIAFAREYEDEKVVVVAPRFFSGLVDADVLPVGREVWGDTAINLEGAEQFGWGDLLTNASVEGRRMLLVGDVCQGLPVALLAGKRKG